MIEVFEDKAGEWRFRVKGLNGEIVATSEGYTSPNDANRGVYALRRIMAEAQPPVRV